MRTVRRNHQLTRGRHVAAAYLGLTKPRIIELLLVTTVPAMFLAAGGVPPLKVVLTTMVGGCLAAASANAFNCVLDRDIDERMRRTRRRPLPRHAVARWGRRCRNDLGDCGDAVARILRQLAVRGTRAECQRVLHRRLHTLAEAAHPAEHHLGRHRGLLPTADRLDSGDRQPCAHSVRDVPHRSSSGRRRTPGPSPCAIGRTTPRRMCRCCRL